MDIETSNITIDRLPVAKDSLKFAGIDTNFNITDIVPQSDSVSTTQNTNYQEEINEKTELLKALQVGKKTLSEVQSLVRDIKSNYKTETNDTFAPLNDDALKQRYNIAMQIKNKLNNAKYNGEDVFGKDYSSENITLDIDKKDLSKLSIKDENVIETFSNNISELGTQIDDAIQKIQGEIDKLQESRWLSLQTLQTIKLEPKSVNASISTTPSLASALALVGSGANSATTGAQGLSNALNTSDSNGVNNESSTTQDGNTSGDATKEASESNNTEATQETNNTANANTESNNATNSNNTAPQNADYTNNTESSTAQSTQSTQAESSNSDNAQGTQTAEQDSTDSNAQNSESNTKNNTNNNAESSSTTTAYNTSNNAQTQASTTQDSNTAQNTNDTNARNIATTNTQTNNAESSTAQNATTHQNNAESNTQNNNIANNTNTTTTESSTTNTIAQNTNTNSQASTTTQNTAITNNGEPIITPTTSVPNMDNGSQREVDAFV